MHENICRIKTGHWVGSLLGLGSGRAEHHQVPSICCVSLLVDKKMDNSLAESQFSHTYSFFYITLYTLILFSVSLIFHIYYFSLFFLFLSFHWVVYTPKVVWGGLSLFFLHLDLGHHLLMFSRRCKIKGGSEGIYWSILWFCLHQTLNFVMSK